MSTTCMSFNRGQSPLLISSAVELALLTLSAQPVSAPAPTSNAPGEGHQIHTEASLRRKKKKQDEKWKEERKEKKKYLQDLEERFKDLGVEICFMDFDFGSFSGRSSGRIRVAGAPSSAESFSGKTLKGKEIICMICYNKFGIKCSEGHVENAARISQCKHSFGEECLKMWFENSNSCPYCREEVPGMQKNKTKHYRRG